MSRELYYINEHLSDEFEIRSGVRQDCVLSILFITYSEEILKKLLKKDLKLATADYNFVYLLLFFTCVPPVH